MKRKAPYSVDQNNIDKEYNDEQEADKNENEGPDFSKVSTQEEIQQRKIIKIKRAQEPPSTDTVQFKLQQQLQNTEPAQQNAQFSFIQSPQSQQKEESNLKSIFTNPEDRPKEPCDPKLFQNNNLASGLKTNGTEEGQNGKNSEEKPKEIPQGGLFSGLFGKTEQTPNLFGQKTSNETPSLFANLSQKSDEKPVGGLFSNISQPTGGLFQSFGSQPPTGGLFSTPLPGVPTGGLFSNINNTQGTGLFSGGTGNVFKSQQQEEDEEEGDDQDEEGQKSPEIDPSKSTSTYVPPDLYDKLIEKNILKFKKNDGNLLEKGSISIEKFKDESKKTILLIYRNHIKQILYQGVLINKLTKFKVINNKNENISVLSFNVDDNKKLVQENIKLQFSNEPDSLEFQKTVKEVCPESFE